MFKVDAYIGVGTTYPKKKKRTCGYILECTTKAGKTIRKERYIEAEATYHEATLTAILEALKSFNQSCEIHLRTQNEFVANMMTKEMDGWATKGFVNAKGKPVRNKELWMQIWKKTQAQLIFVTIGEHKYTGQMKAREKECLKNSEK